MTSTEEKLEEAEYFLDLMKKDPLDYSKFKFHLSAFLSASRSITFIMQKEFRNQKFIGWYSEKQKEFTSNPLLAYFNDKRTRSIHTEVIHPNKHVTIKLKESLSIKTKVAEFILNGQTKNTKIIESEVINRVGKPCPEEPEVLHCWFFNDKPEKDLVSLCEEYMCYLRTLVEESVEASKLITVKL